MHIIPFISLLRNRRRSVSVCKSVAAFQRRCADNIHPPYGPATWRIAAMQDKLISLSRVSTSAAMVQCPGESACYALEINHLFYVTRLNSCSSTSLRKLNVEEGYKIGAAPGRCTAVFRQPTSRFLIYSTIHNSHGTLSELENLLSETCTV
jgi:hypothetical protein